MHFNYITKMAQKPLLRWSLNIQYTRGFDAYHCLVLILPVLCLRKEDGFQRNNTFLMFYWNCHARTQETMPLLRSPEIYNFGRDVHAQHTWSKPNLSNQVKKRFFKEKMHFHCVTKMFMPLHIRSWNYNSVRGRPGYLIMHSFLLPHMQK